MKTSESITSIAPALLKAQKAIKFAVKDANNPHFKSKYADLSSVIEAIKQPLNDAGILFIQTPSPSETGTLSLTTRLIHESGEWIEDTATMPLPRHDPQGFGSAMTYCRRYALAAAVGVYQDDDDGNTGSGVDKSKKTIKPTDGVKDALEDRLRAQVEKLAAHIQAQFDADNEWGAFEAWDLRDQKTFDQDASTAVWSLLSSKCRSTIKTMAKEAEATA
jgi:hypothetical protein